MLKAAVKHGSGEDKVRHRVVPPEAVSKWAEKLNSMKGEISGILQEEKEEKQVSCRGLVLYIIVIIVTSSTDSPSGDGAQERAKYDGA